MYSRTIVDLSGKNAHFRGRETLSQSCVVVERPTRKMAPTTTGQYSYESLGLDYYIARFYDPTIARFAQADTIVPGGVQGYDRYAYTANNPVKYSDPTGHWACEDASGCDHIDKDQSKYLREHAKERAKLNELSDQQKQALRYLQSCASQALPFNACAPYAGKSISNWPPSGYYVSGYKTNISIQWTKIDWLGLGLSGAGVIGDTATILTVVAAATPGAQVITPVIGSIAAAGEVVNKAAVGYNIYKTVAENNPSGSTVDLITIAFKDAGPMIPVISLGSNLSGVVDAVRPAIDVYQQPILSPVVPTSITTSP